MRHVIPVVVTTTPAGYHQPRALALYREPRVDTYHHHPPPPPPPAAAAGAASCSCQQLCIQLACSVCHIPHAVPCAPTLTHDAKPGATRTVTRTMPYCSPSSQARQNQRSSRFTSPGPVRRPTSPDAVRMARDHSRSCMCHSIICQPTLGIQENKPHDAARHPGCGDYYSGRLPSASGLSALQGASCRYIPPPPAAATAASSSSRCGQLQLPTTVHPAGMQCVSHPSCGALRAYPHP